MKKLISYTITIILWVVSIILWVTGVFPWLCIALLALHFIELITIGYRTGRLMRKHPIAILTMTMLFGVSWWGPLQKEILADELSEDDFIEDGAEPWREINEVAQDSKNSGLSDTMSGGVQL